MITISDLQEMREYEMLIPDIAFPKALQRIATEWYVNNDFRKEYTYSCMLVAASLAIGNAMAIRVKGDWVATPSLYMMLVGRPGLGKTPPLNAVLAPLYKLDRQLLDDYRRRRAMAGKDEEVKPLTQYLIKDSTPEALVRAHDNNRRGVAIVNDELIGFFNTANRYNSGNLIEMLLSAFSGDTIKVTRMSNDEPIAITDPFINIIGGIQTTLVGELLAKGYKKNGLLDRFLFALPADNNINEWSAERPSAKLRGDGEISAHEEWERMLGLIMRCVPYDSGSSRVLELEDDARGLLYDWRNALMARVNSIDDDSEVDSRVMKSVAICARLALIVEVMHWAVDLDPNKPLPATVGYVAVAGAIKLMDYYEECYRQIMEKAGGEAPCPIDALLSALPEEFTTSMAVDEAIKRNISSRSCRRHLLELLKTNRLWRPRRGYYRKPSR